MRPLHTLLLFITLSINPFFFHAQESSIPPIDAYLVEGDCIAFPKFGFNGKVELGASANPWADTEFTDLLESTKPTFIRYPGGTAANAWSWVPYCMDDLGNKTFYWNDSELLCVGDEIFESSSLSKNKVLKFGCGFQCTSSTSTTYPEDYKCIVKKNAWKLMEFKTAMDAIGAKPVYVLRMMDPLVQAELADGSLFNARSKIRDSLLLSMRRQVAKILSVYVSGGAPIAGINLNDPSSFDNSSVEYTGEVHFELGNELYAGRYGRFFPTGDCFDSTLDICQSYGCNEFGCKPSPRYYAALCNLVIPIIRSKFKNAKISVVGGNRNKPAHDWSLKVFEDLTVDYEAMTFHAYPNTDVLVTEDTAIVEDLSFVNSSLIGHIAYDDSLGIGDSLIAHDKELWVTEYNIGDTITPQFSYNWKNVLVFSDVINAYLLRLEGLQGSQFEQYWNATDEYPIAMMLAQKVAGQYGAHHSAIIPYSCGGKNYTLSAFGAGMYLWNVVAKGANYASPIHFSQHPTNTPNSDFYHTNDTIGSLFCFDKAVIDTFPKLYGWKFNNGKIIVVNHSDRQYNLIGGDISSGAVMQYVTHFSPTPEDTLLSIPSDFPLVNPGSTPYRSCANLDYQGGLTSDWTVSPIIKANSITLIRTSLGCPEPEVARQQQDDFKQRELKIFPNPGHGQFQIDYPEEFTTGDLSIYDYSGQLIKRYQLEANALLPHIELPRSGMYLVVLRDAQQQWTEKLISLK